MGLDYLLGSLYQKENRFGNLHKTWISISKKKQFNKLPKILKAWVLHYGYYDKQSEVWIICVDDARFFNHSDNPNTDNITENETVAKRNIKKDEELTCNYFEFDADARRKLKIKNLR